MAFLAEMRQRLRIEDRDFDGELRSLIEAVRAELRLAGIRPAKAKREKISRAGQPPS
jgi:hypothetical protein